MEGCENICKDRGCRREGTVLLVWNENTRTGEGCTRRKPCRRLEAPIHEVIEFDPLLLRMKRSGGLWAFRSPTLLLHYC